MVARNQINRNALVAQSSHLPPEKEAGAVILPISVIEITSNDQKINAFIDCQLDQVLESPSRCTAEDINRCPFMRIKTFKRAVNVSISGMDETYHVHAPVTAFTGRSRKGSWPRSCDHTFLPNLSRRRSDRKQVNNSDPRKEKRGSLRFRSVLAFSAPTAYLNHSHHYYCIASKTLSRSISGRHGCIER